MQRVIRVSRRRDFPRILALTSQPRRDRHQGGRGAGILGRNRLLRLRVPLLPPPSTRQVGGHLPGQVAGSAVERGGAGAVNGDCPIWTVECGYRTRIRKCNYQKNRHSSAFLTQCGTLVRWAETPRILAFFGVSGQFGDELITSRSQVRILSPQLQPHGSETSRPWGFVLRWRRDGAAYPQVSQGFATLRRSWSLFRRRARPDLFTRLALRRPVSGPNSRPSLCLAPPGLRGVGFALSVPTPRGWLR